MTSIEEAREAYAGGADRLEVVRELELGGLTPSAAVVDQIAAAVPLPMRVMVRESPTMAIGGEGELERLVAAARVFDSLPVQGLVLGFLHDGVVDERSLQHILAAAPRLRATFHRAFEQVSDPLLALTTLKRFEQIDRVLIRVASGMGHAISDIARCQDIAAPQIRFICGVGLNQKSLRVLKHHPKLTEIHVGRLARDGHKVCGPVSRALVADLKSALA